MCVISNTVIIVSLFPVDSAVDLCELLTQCVSQSVSEHRSFNLSVKTKYLFIFFARVFFNFLVVSS